MSQKGTENGRCITMHTAQRSCLFSTSLGTFGVSRLAFARTYTLDTPNAKRNGSSHDMCVIIRVAGGEIPGDRGAGVSQRRLGQVAKTASIGLSHLLSVPTLELYEVRSRALAHVHVADVMQN